MVRRSEWLRLAAAIMLLLLLWCYTPSADPRFRLCGFHWLTGLPCPLCGMTRAIFALGKGHFREAIGFNALSPVGFLMLFGLFGTGRVRGGLWTAGLIVFGVYGAIRVFIPGV